jgi:penicillin-insensitive murein endopeptidase
VKFDVARNWALVAALVSDEAIELKWIFVSGALREVLLAQGRKSKASPKVLAAAERLLHQPSDAPPHDDHFHVRIRCSQSERDEGCVD